MTLRGDDEIAGAADLEDEYEIIAELGRGGSAIVYRARDRRLARDVAIKVVRARGLRTGDEPVARLAREARTVAQIDHPLIVKVYAVRPLVDGLALVMQWVPGRTLKQRIIEEGPLPVHEARSVLRDVATALAAAHVLGIVHRDVKPENIFLDAQHGRAMLSDFGIAQSHELDARLTQTGVAIGTPTYMAPEQIDGTPATARSDVYSLGLVAWEMLTGRQPWSGASLYGILHHQKHDALPPIGALRDDVPETLQYLVERALQKRPAARWAGAEGLLAQLDGTVLPPDWPAWQRMHRARLRSVQERPVPPPAVAAAQATVPYRRDEAAGANTATPSAADSGPIETTRDPDDDVPDWGIAPPSSSRTVRVAAGAAAVATALVLGGLFAQREWRARPTTSVVARTDVPAVRSIPVLPPARAPATVETRADSGRSDDADESADESIDAPDVDRLDTSGVARIAASTRGGSRGAVSMPRSAASVARDSAAATLAERSDGRAAASVVRIAIEPARIAAGGHHTCALDRERVRCWGDNADGQLGIGDDVETPFAEPVSTNLPFVAVATGVGHSCALTREGAAYCWGGDDSGQLGDATTIARSAPVRVATGLSFRALRAGRAHTCGLTDAGQIACWGDNRQGQLGDGTTVGRATPVLVPTTERWSAVAAGWGHTCGVTRQGAAFCWGDNRDGQLGDGSTTPRRTPAPVASDVRFRAIATGAGHSCGVSTEGQLWCWGRNAAGQVGTGTRGAAVLRPTRVTALSGVRSVALGTVHSCARAENGMAWCWGGNPYGQLGDGSTTDHLTPARVSGGWRFETLDASSAHTCGVTTSGDVLCWGYNADGQLGDSTVARAGAAHPRPTRVPLPSR